MGDAGGNLAEADQILEVANATLHRPDRGQVSEKPEEAEESALFEKRNGGDADQRIRFFEDDFAARDGGA